MRLLCERPTRSSTRGTWRITSRVWAPVTCIAKATFSQTVLSSEQLEILEDDAEMAAQCRHAAPPQTIDADAVDDDFAGRRSRFAVEQTKQTRLSGSRVPDKEDEIAFRNLEANVVEGAHSVRIDKRNAAEGDHRWERSLNEARGYTFAMDFDLTDEQRAMPGLAREFARDEVRPRAEEMDRNERFPYELIAKMAELGFMGLPVSRRVRRRGRRHGQLCARGDGDRARRRLDGDHDGRARLARCDALLSFWNRSPEARVSRPARARRALMGLRPHRAERRERRWERADERPSCATGKWVINGTKAFITNSGTEITGGTTITAVTGRRADGSREISNIIVPQDTPGFTRSRKYAKMGWRASDTRELSFVDAEVPEENLLGPRGEGYRQFLSILDGGRISVAALSIGLAMGAYDEALAYAQRAARIRPADQQVSGDLVQARRHAYRDRARQAHDVARRVGERPGARLRPGRELRQALCRRALAPRRQRSPPNPRRIRLYGRISNLPHVPRSEDQRDRRRNQRSSAPDSRTPDGVVERTTEMRMHLPLLAAIVAFCLTAPASAALSTGTKAPDFTLQATQGGNVFTFNLARRAEERAGRTLLLSGRIHAGMHDRSARLRRCDRSIQGARRDGDRRLARSARQAAEVFGERMPQQVCRRGRYEPDGR